MRETMISILVLTYNHEEYITQALDSILMQKVNFKYEIIIGDDCSKDNTQEVLIRYKEKYPDTIKLVLRQKNVGATKNGYEIARMAVGKYIAYLEGDDYWTHQDKLQKQIEFLEREQEFIACVHKCKIVDRLGKIKRNIPTNHGFWDRSIYSKEEYEKGTLPGQTATLVHRNIYIDTNIDCEIMCRASKIVGDWTIVLLLLSKGKIYCLDEVMSHYRQVIDKDSSSWSALQHNGNVRDEYFYTQMELEEYANNILKMNIDFTRRKKEIYISAIFKWLRELNWFNFKVILNILRRSRQPIYYIMFGIYILMKKLIYIIWYRDNRKVEY